MASMAEAKTPQRGRRATSGRRPHLVSPAHFVLATRDSGYRTTSLAVAEFIDNAIQAGASDISIDITSGDDPVYPIEILVVDNGRGMTSGTLERALTFGGSERFDDRSSLGRYGMGLPNGALSRARRVEVYSWRSGTVVWSRLDVDEIVSAGRRTLPPVEVVPRGALPFSAATSSGTAVRLLRCDRIEVRRVSTLLARLKVDLGRIYRRFLKGDLVLTLNGREIRAVDPLYLQRGAVQVGGAPFGDTLRYRLSTSSGTGEVTVRFSELPLERWHHLPADEKRALGITNAPCVSVLRAGREIDRGWFFMGGKRRENYDDWWRCEVNFDPVLDDMFGITHSKQAISPTEELLTLLAPDLEPIARALNARVRHRFELVKVGTPLSAAEEQAARAHASLPSLPRRKDEVPPALQAVLAERVAEVPYQIIVGDLETTAAYEVVLRSGRLAVVLNARHPLYRDLYGPLASSDSDREQAIAKHVALAVLAAARAEVAGPAGQRLTHLRSFRQAWADVLATFFNA